MRPPELDALIHQPTRLRIMALLHRNRQASFTWVRDALGLTDGNLASHAARLEEAGYIEGGRVLTTAGFQVRYRMTQAGHDAFAAYLFALRRYLDTEALGVPGAPASGEAPPGAAEAGARPAPSRPAS